MKTTRGIHGVTKKTDLKSPLKPMHINPTEEPPTPKHRSPHGTNPMPEGAKHATAKKTKKDAKKRPRNKGR